MEKDIYIDLRDSYIEIQGDEKQIAQFEEDMLKGKITFQITTKPPVKLTKKNVIKFLKYYVEIIIFFDDILHFFVLLECTF